MALEIKWMASLSANACHAADLARRRLALDCPLVEAAVRPAQWLGEEIRAAGLPEGPFWDYLLPLSAQLENNRQLVEAVLRRMLPPKQRVDNSRVTHLAGCIADLEAAVAQAQPDLVEALLPRAERARAEWDAVGPGLLERIAALTDPGVIPGGATVVPLWPAWGGFASVHLAWNLARVELDAEGVRLLPDAVRIAWLLAQLNLELPMFSETITAGRLPEVAALAMLPPTLQAAAEARLVDRAVALNQAFAALPLEIADPSSTAEKMETWWQTYLDARPGWDVALAALERLQERP
jgi:hypothetical protein